MSGSVDARAFRTALGTFLTGVTIVTTRQPDGTPRGFTANSFTSVSLSPPLILVCIAKTASSYPLFSEASHFAVNILAEEQRHVANVFASKALGKFEHVRWADGALGSPVIEGCCAWLECRVHQRIEAGDHQILIGEVVDFTAGTARPLGYCRGGYVSLGLEQTAVQAAGERGTRIGAIVEADGMIALDCTNPERPRLPTSATLGPATNPDSLTGRFAAAGFAVRLGFLYSVYGDGQTTPHGGPHFDENDPMRVFYRGTLTGPWPEGGVFRPFAIAALPWDRLDANEAHMLRRYVRERETNAFGVYGGADDMVHPIRGDV